MIYTPLTKIAIQLALDAHRGQFDKGGLPYATHPIHIADSMDTEDECVVALLHDVLEDTELTVSDLQQWGITDRQIEAIKLLCHDESVPYLEYIQKIQLNPIARKVKLADLKHNSDLSRLSTVTPQDIARVEKYQKAIQILMAD